ncbi:hypothetical protein GO730_35010 [Spirosoma sp. HMF3257]|uniref:Uncharacterized protein n=1 Tax=Spirosoma telluris TaxID=2183553 RepID=A0A327NVX0_9BACT|nr:hypothetical protein [Spirosoma telluris]RAI77994.1 hypothetical protein HMF3257_34910 [Spirosoma telluris]
MTTFTETQRFRQWWLWLMLSAVAVVTASPLWINSRQNYPSSWIGFTISLLVIFLFYSWRLDTRLDSTGIHYRVFPIFSWRTILWNDVRTISITQYSFVGYGIRLGFDGWVYNIAGNKSLRIDWKTKQKITIGTQRPDELQAFLDTRISLTTT